MDAKQHYFVCYTFEKYGTSERQLCNILIDELPLKWCKDLHEQFTDGKYTLVSWQKISKEEFDQYEGWFG